MILLKLLVPGCSPWIAPPPTIDSLYPIALDAHHGQLCHPPQIAYTLSPWMLTMDSSATHHRQPIPYLYTATCTCTATPHHLPSLQHGSQSLVDFLDSTLYYDDAAHSLITTNSLRLWKVTIYNYIELDVDLP